MMLSPTMNHRLQDIEGTAGPRGAIKGACLLDTSASSLNGPDK